MNTLKKTNAAGCLFPFLLALLFIAGCKSDKYNNLTDEELSWMIYSDNTPLKFQNDSGATRTYTTTQAARGYLDAGSSKDEHVAISFVLLNDTNPHPSSGTLHIIKKSAGLSVEVNWPYYPVTMYPLQLPVTTETVNGITYSDVYVSRTVGAGYDVIEIHYSKTKGIIRFIESDNTRWSLIN